MKKLFKTTLLMSALAFGASTASAATMNLGYSQVDLGQGISGPGGGIGWDISLPLDGRFIPISGLELGFGSMFNGYSVSKDTGDGSSFMLGISGEATLGYRFFHNKMKASAGLGYGYLSVNSIDFIGMQYSANLNYNFSEKYGVKVSYTKASLSPSVGNGTLDANKIGVFFTIQR